MKTDNQKPGLFILILTFPLTRIILGCLALLFIPYLFKEFVFDPILPSIIENEETRRGLQHLLTILLVFLTYRILFKYYENRRVSELHKNHFFRDNIRGIILGILCISTIIGILWIFGYYEILSSNGFKLFTLPLISIIMLAFFEEVLFRGVVYRISEKSLGTVLALIISAFLFGIIHITNENANWISVLSITSAGLSLGILYTYSKTLWLPTAFHVFWNFSQAFWGSPVSGTETFGTFFNASFQGPKLLTGDAFGLENSLLSVIVCLGVFILFYIRSQKTSKIITPFWK